jgi:dTDP-4-dehydrorhamnose 3,5-epimerase
MTINPTGISGCFEILAEPVRDKRGSFTKTLNRSAFLAAGLKCDFVEGYYTISGPGVLRGFHFQVPPKQHAKLVFCTAGKVLDVVLDLRAGSDTYGNHLTFDLSASKGNSIYIPEGVAHAFFVVDGPATLVYHVTSEYSPAHDAGIRWDSAGVIWPIADPVISDRDSGFPTLRNFESPFVESEKPTEAAP